MPTLYSLIRQEKDNINNSIAMLLGGNYTLCSLDSILEYCFKQIQESRAAIIAYGNIPDGEKETIFDYLSSPFHLESEFSFGANRNCCGYHMSITPFHNETIDDEEAVAIAKERILEIGTTSRPWVLIKEVAINTKGAETFCMFDQSMVK